MSWIQDFGWKKKAETLRMTMLSAGHQVAIEIQPGLANILQMFKRTAVTKDGTMLLEEIRKVANDPIQVLWEPGQILGWSLNVTMYRKGDEIWWLVHAQRKDDRQTPSEKDVSLLDKVLEHLGANPVEDMIIGPSSSPPGEPALAFGWWTWRNVAPLFEVQVNKDRKGKDAIRIVRLGAEESDGYARIELKGAPPR